MVTPHATYVVRWSSSDASLLGIDRDAEHFDTAAAAAAGVGAEVFDYRPDLGMLVIGFLPGSALVDDAFADAGVLARAADATRRLHAGPRFAGQFDMFARQATYRATVEEQGFTLPAGYDDHADAWADVRRVLAARPRLTVPCNNDLLAGDHRRRRAGLAHRLRVQRQPRRRLRARQHGHGVRVPAEWVEAYAEASYGHPPGDLAGVRLGALRKPTGGHSGDSSKRPRAPSTSTSTAGASTATRRPRAPSAVPTSRGS